MKRVKLSRTTQYIKAVLRRFHQDGCLEAAASLSFTSLLALTPILAIAFAILSAFPAFEGMAERIETLVFNSFVPAAGETIRVYVRGFVKNASHSTLFGVSALAITSILLLLEIQVCFQKIWKWRQGRTPVQNLVAFWTTLTMGPLLLGVSLSVSSYLFAGVKLLDASWAAGVSSAYLVFLPVFMEWLAFFLMYVLVPNSPIRWRYSMIGAAFATMLFEILKTGFGLYVTHFPFYEVLYGTLATLPIFLLWLYLSWGAALLGAEVVATLPERDLLSSPEGTQVQSETTFSPTYRLSLSLSILELFYENASEGTKLKEQKILKSMSASPGEVHELLELLEMRGYLAYTEPGGYVLCRDLHRTTLSELFHSLGLDYPVSDVDAFEGVWTGPLKVFLEELGVNSQKLLSKPLADLFQP
jgi:membrane protein